jgi:integrase
LADLSTPTSRRRLPRSREETWVRLGRGRSLGYRRPGPEAGTWHVRVFVGRGGTGSPYRRKVLATADDQAPADGVTIFTYGQAIEKALAWEPGDDEAEDLRRPLTVRQADERYSAWYAAHRRSYDCLRYTFEAHILPELGDVRVEALTAERLRRWHQKLAEAPARMRGGNRRKATTEDAKRARKATANGILKDLKAALNRALEDGLVERGDAWRRVKPFHGVDAPRSRYLEPEDLRRFLNACRPDFRQLALAASYTGARYSELAALSVQDFRPEASAVHFPKTKSGAPRYVYLPDEGLVFFERLAAGRKPTDRLLRRKGGTPWGQNHHYRLMVEACKKAGVEPLGFHQLRHTYASLYLMSGGSLVALAKQLGHTTTRMVEKHYGHLADSWRAQEARKHAPSLGLEAGWVVRMRRRPEPVSSAHLGSGA